MSGDFLADAEPLGPGLTVSTGCFFFDQEAEAKTTSAVAVASWPSHRFDEGMRKPYRFHSYHSTYHFGVKQL